VPLELISSTFICSLNTIRTITASPSEPQYYRVHIPEKLDSVVVKVDSDDSICMTVSIQSIEVLIHSCDVMISLAVSGIRS
jgi:hypothetical protein